MSKEKYRPVLTASQISHLISLCKKDLSSESLLCISILAPFEYKIQNGSISPSYRLIPKIGLSEAMGMDEDIDARLNSETLSRDKKQYADYLRYIHDPSACNLEQIKSAQAYMWTNDLMTESQEQEYQNSLISSSK